MMESQSLYSQFSYLNTANPCYEDYGSYSSYPSSGYYYNAAEQGSILTEVIVSTVFGIITIVGLIGNFTVIFVTLRSRSMRGVTNIFIMNNAISDILFLLLCVPITALQFLFVDWIFGAFVCKFFAYIQHVAVQASCATLVAMTLDRYKVILQPMESLSTRTVTRTSLTNLSIWAMSLLLHVPSLVFFNVRDECNAVPYCGIEIEATVYFLAYAIISKLTMYIIPFIIMSFCYLRIVRSIWNKYQLASMHTACHDRRRRQKVKVTQMTVLVVLLFGICWGPLHVMHLVVYFDGTIPGVNLYTFFLCLAYSNAALNPFVYALSGRYYREILQQSCFPTCGLHSKKRKTVMPPTSTTRVGARRPSLEIPANQTDPLNEFNQRSGNNYATNGRLKTYLAAKESKAEEESPLRRIPDVDQDIVNHRAEILRRKYSLDDDCV